MIKLDKVSKVYNVNKPNEFAALKNISFELPDNGMIFITGKSGSGKTTLLNLLGGLDSPTSGELCLDDKKIDLKKRKFADEYRRNYTGFVFQDFNLIEYETVFENVNIAARLLDKNANDVTDVLKKVGLDKFARSLAGNLSGGQKQRVAIARALIKYPKIILADEPTGNLDSENAGEIFDLLKRLSKDRLVVVVSHDEDSVAKYADGVLSLDDGNLVSNTIRIPTIAVKQNDDNREKKSTTFKTVIRLGVKNVHYKVGKTVVATLMLILSLTILLWGQMLFSTSTEKVVGRNLRRYPDGKLLFYKETDINVSVDPNGIDVGNKVHYPLSSSDIKSISDFVPVIPIYGEDMTSLAMISGIDDIKKCGFSLAPSSREIAADDEVYVSDFYIADYVKSEDVITDFDKYIDSEIEIQVAGQMKTVKIAGVFYTNYEKYFEYSYGYRGYYRKSNLNMADSQIAEYIAAIKNIYFGRKNFAYTGVPYIAFNYYVSLSKQKDGSVKEYGRQPVRFSTATKEITVDNTLYLSDKNFSVTEVGADEIYLSWRLYARLFGEKINPEEPVRHIGEKIKITLAESDMNPTEYSVKEKIFKGIKNIDDTSEKGSYSMLMQYRNDEEFLTRAVRPKIIIANFGGLSSTRIAKILSNARLTRDLIGDGWLVNYVYLTVESGFNSARIIMVGIGALTCLISVFVIVNLILSVVSSKVKEIGILKAIGLNSREISFIYQLKIFFLSIISFICSSLISLIAIPLLAKAFGDSSFYITWVTYDLTSAALAFTVAVIVPVAISFISLLKINKMKPVDAIRTL